MNKIKIKLNELQVKTYADCSTDQPIPIIFNFADIKKAIDENRYDKRSFQVDLTELKNEWNRNSNNDYKKYIENSKKYHIERIAYLIKSNLWKFPIDVYSDLKTIKDGQHRIWAAKYLNQSEIEACVCML